MIRRPPPAVGKAAMTPKVPPREKPSGSMWALLGLLIAVAVTVTIIASGLAAA